MLTHIHRKPAAETPRIYAGEEAASSFLSTCAGVQLVRRTPAKFSAFEPVKSSSPMLADGLLAGSTAPTLKAFNHLPQSVDLEKHPTVPMYSPVT